MGLISPGGENLLDFLELRQVLSTYNGDLRDPLWWPQERPGPCELLGGHSQFHSRRCRGLRPCVESVPEPEDSSPVLTWILGYFWSLHPDLPQSSHPYPFLFPEVPTGALGLSSTGLLCLQKMYTAEDSMLPIRLAPLLGSLNFSWIHPIIQEFYDSFFVPPPTRSLVNSTYEVSPASIPSSPLQ